MARARPDHPLGKACPERLPWQAVEGGLADRTVAVLLADLPELGTVSNKPVPSAVEWAVAKLVGLVPLLNDSRTRHGARFIRGIRASVRSILCPVADLARKYDPDLAASSPKTTPRDRPHRARQEAPRPPQCKRSFGPTLNGAG